MKMLHNERKFGKIIAGWVEELACHQKTFQSTIPAYQGQLSGNKLNYRVWFIIGGGYSNELNDCLCVVCWVGGG